MSKLIVHIGRPKTGTSYLQNFLKKNKDFLYKEGFNYITFDKASMNLNKIFKNLIRSVYNRLEEAKKLEAIESAKNHLKQNILNDKVSIISSEAISNLDKNVFDEIFKNYKVLIVAYIRNELDFLASSYCQYIASNWDNLDFGSYISPLRLNISSNDTFVKKIENFKCNSIIIRKYSKNCLVDRNIAKDFITNVLKINLNTNNFDFNEIYKNISISDEVVEFKRQLVQRSYSGFNDKELFSNLKTLSTLYGKRFKIPIIYKQKILNVILSKSNKFIKYDISFPINEYENYKYLNKKILIKFDSMLKTLKSIRNL